jgi:hypothetical protein
VQHRRPEDGGQVVQRHLVLRLELAHPDHVLDEEDDARLGPILQISLRTNHGKRAERTFTDIQFY